MLQEGTTYRNGSAAFEQWAKTVVECLQVLPNLNAIRRVHDTFIKYHLFGELRCF